MGLRVYKSECDWVVAESEDDAWKAWEEYMGDTREGYDDSFDPEPDDKLLTIWLDDPPGDKCDCLRRKRERKEKIEKERAAIRKLPPSEARGNLFDGVSKPLDTHPNGHVVGCTVGSERLTCAEWAKKNGRGLLASTEY